VGAGLNFGSASRSLLLGAVLYKQNEQASDLDLVRLAGKGDGAAFEEIIRRYGPRVFRIASQFFRQREKVEEAAQDVFLQAYKQLASFEGRGSFEGWLSRITAHVCLNIVRTARRRPESLVTDLSEDETKWLDRQVYEAPDPRDRSIEHDVITADLAEKLLNVLPAEDRFVVTLIDGNDLSVKEVADLIGWSESKVKIRAMRGRQRMRRAVESLLKTDQGTRKTEQK